MVKILFAEQEGLLKEGIKHIIESRDEMQIAAEVENGKAACAYVNGKHKFDLVIVGWNEQDAAGLDWLERIKKIIGSIPVLIVTCNTDLPSVQSCFKKGASGYISHDAKPEDFIFAITTLLSGDFFISSLLSKTLLTNTHLQKKSSLKPFNLSLLEEQVITEIANGQTSEEIAGKFGLNKRNLERHRATIIKKCKVKNSLQLVKFAVEHGMLIS